jgi:hypothetical protein
MDLRQARELGRSSCNRDEERQERYREEHLSRDSHLETFFDLGASYRQRL